LALFDTPLPATTPHLIPARLNHAALRAQATAGQLSPVFDRLVPLSHQGEAVTAGPDAPALEKRLRGLPEAEQDQILLDLVRDLVATVLAYSSPRQVDVERGFMEMGFDSLTAVELRNRLNAATGLRMPPSVVFDYPTPSTLARHTRSEITANEPATSRLLITELNKLEAELQTIPEQARTHLSSRLQDLLSKLASIQSSTKDAAPAITGKIESATDDEVFDFIDNELRVR
ncbi:MAG TPA: phosphopantetheine-binding protein, partial [Streptosporangiaceae bacterium]